MATLSGGKSEFKRIPGLKTYLHIPMKYTSAMKEGYSRNNLQQRKKIVSDVYTKKHNITFIQKYAWCKNIRDTLSCTLCATFQCLPHFDIIDDLLLNRPSAT